MANLYVTRIVPQAKLPHRKTPFSAGMDVACCFHEKTVTIYDDDQAPERSAIKNEMQTALNYFRGAFDIAELENPNMSVDSVHNAFGDYVFDDHEEADMYDALLTGLDQKNRIYVERKVVDGQLIIYPGERALIPTGLKMSCDVNHYLAFYPRSGNALKRGLTLINCTGIGDRDYQDEYYIAFVNNSRHAAIIDDGENVAQLIVRYYADVDICERPQGLPEVNSNRDGGFGSTGK